MVSQSKPIYSASEETAEELLSGGNDYQDNLVYFYLLNLIKQTDVSSPVAYLICSAFESASELIPDYSDDKGGFPFKKKKAGDKISYPTKKKPERGSVDQKDWDFLKERLEKQLKNFNPEDGKPVPIQNLEMLGESLLLNQVEKEILVLLYAIDGNVYFEGLMQDIIGNDQSRVPAIAARFLGRKSEIATVTKTFSNDSPLYHSGLLEIIDPDSDDQVFPQIEYSIKLMLPTVGLDTSRFIENVLGKPATAELAISDFSTLQSDIEKICKIIRSAIAKDKKGINILLHGPSGSGKTVLAAAIASELKLQLFAIGEDKDQSESYDEQSNSSKHRLNKLFQAHSFIRDKKDSILLFDELEDLLLKGTDNDKKADTQSKIIINRLLENNPVVTIWAGNNPEKFHESMRQRFAYSLYVDYPPTLIRKKVVQKQLALNGATLPEEDILDLARNYLAPPRMIANAIGLSALTEEVTLEAVESFLTASSKITYGDSEAIKSQTRISRKFDLSLINYDGSKDNKVKTIIAQASKPRPYSMLVQAPAGSGVRSFARYLAEKAVMNTAEHDMRFLTLPSQMKSPQIKIREAFSEAADSRNLLVISNIEALSANPDSSSSSWSESGLGEVFMECLYDHKLPVMVSTYNRQIEIPEFIKNAFSLDLSIRTLTPEQAEKAFEIYFGCPPEGCILPKASVPADFSKVAKVLKKRSQRNAGHCGYCINAEFANP